MKDLLEISVKYFAIARGCKIEHEIALQYGLEIIYETKIL